MPRQSAHAAHAANTATWASLAGVLGAVLLPKCPLCFAAYGSALGALGLSPAAAQGRLFEPLLAVAILASTAIVAGLALRRADRTTAVLAAAGAALALAGRFALDSAGLTLAGAALLVAASVVNTVRCRGRLCLTSSLAEPRPSREGPSGRE